MRLLLASASPRRADLLRAAGFEVDVVPSGVEERREPSEPAEAYVRRLAEAKAVAVGNGAHPVVAADTVVVVEGAILEKPADDREAAEMLRRISGRSHEVLTGVTVRVGLRSLTHVERTRVVVAPLSDSEIAWYVRSGEPRDKAGAYAIQGLASRFIDAVEGSYPNVVGLPVAAVCRLLRALGADPSES